MNKWKWALLFSVILCLCTGSSRAAAPAGYLALTFDDGPSGRITRRLLEGLEERDVRATFFLCGYRLEEYPKIAPLIAAGGHELGLHGYSHKSMKAMSAADLGRELQQTRALLRQQTGKGATLLRPPGGCCSDTVSRVARSEGHPIILWSLDTRDWSGESAAAIAKTITGKARDGDIVLLHDMQMETVKGVLSAVDTLQERGFVFLTVSELADLRGVTLQPGEQYRCFPSQELGEARQ